MGSTRAPIVASVGNNNGLPVDTTWLGGYYVQSIAIDPNDSQTIYAAGFGGLYKSTDGGQLWKRQ
jgi:photosystem II stability/assembly factor-like uncharacterized protein